MTNHDDDNLRLSQNTLRLLIGLLGLSLPLLLIVGAWVLQTSISDYYYTNMRDYFEGVLFFLAIFLFAYRPYGQDGWGDNLITTIGAGLALLVALFPTVNLTLGRRPAALVLQFIPVDWSATVHLLSAGGLFVCFAVMSLAYFTRGRRGPEHRRKALRNLIYRLCGLGILACIGWIAFEILTTSDPVVRDRLDILVPEASALVLFGVSWLTKGGLIFPDKSPRQP